jgi:hypothetical protein
MFLTGRFDWGRFAHQIWLLSNMRAGPNLARLSLSKNYPAPGAEFSGAPPTETGPTGSGNRDVFLRDVPTERARAFGCGMEDVVSGITAFCRESTRAISEET